MPRKGKGYLDSWMILGGLWGLDVVDAKLSKFSSEKEQRLALKIQLSFWEKVIGVKCARTYFTIPSGCVMKPESEGSQFKPH